MRPSDRFALFVAGMLLLLGGAGWHAHQRQAAGVDDVRAMRSMARRLGITDLSLFVEARYTRHPSQADRFSAFQDHPTSLEHFPSGSVVPAP